jgi:Bacterial Ig domain
LTFVPNTGFVGTVTFPYIISDGNGGTATANQTINIPNGAPDAVNNTGVTSTNIPLILDLLPNDSDPDGHALTITNINGTPIVSGTKQTIVVPNGIVTVSSGGVITFTPDRLYTGPVNFPYTISDGYGVTSGPQGCFVSVISAENYGTFGTLGTGMYANLTTPPGSPYFHAPYTNGGTPASSYVVVANNTISQRHQYGIYNNIYGHTTGRPDDAFVAVNGSLSSAVFYK